MSSEAARHADFDSVLRYAQCWEDADVMLQALQPVRGGSYLSIASAGDNTLSLISSGAERVIAVDLSRAQLSALELRVAAYRELSHGELLELLGSRPSTRREVLYARLRTMLSASARALWDARPASVRRGVGGAGRFEHYLALFRTRVLPMVHRRERVEQLLSPRPAAERAAWYDTHWDTLGWRALFRTFFSRLVLGRLGRDPSFFRYVEGSVADHLLARTRHALAELDPTANPYVQWILLGRHGTALPHALREENFDAIRSNLEALEWHCTPLEDLASAGTLGKLSGANLSDIFEYVSVANQRAMLEHLADSSAASARLAYWNMMVPRAGAEILPQRLRALPDLSSALHASDKAFFYRAFVVEEVVC